MKRLLIFLTILLLIPCVALSENAPVSGGGGGATGGDNLGTATYLDVVGLWGPCTGALLSDGTCVDLSTYQTDLAVPSQAEAEAGVATIERVWTALRIAQAIAALSPGGTDEFVYQADCSGITNGLCVDSDDGNIYYYNGASVVQLYPITESDPSVDTSAEIIAILNTAPATFITTPSSAPASDYQVANKKYVDDNVVGGDDANAIHDDESGEIHAITEKTTGLDADELLIESAADTYAKRRVTWANFWANYLSAKVGATYPNVTIGTANGLSLSTQELSLAAATNSSAGAATAAQIQTLESLDAKLPACTPGDGDCGAEVPPNTLAVASWSAPTTGTNAGIRPFTGGRWYVYDISNTTWRLLTIAEDWDTWAEHPALTSAYFLLGNGSNQATAVQMSGDATMANDGAVTVANNAITAGKIADWYAYDVLPIGWAEDGTAAPDAIDDTTRDPLAYRTFAADSTEDVNFVWFVPSDLSGTTVQYRVKYLVTNATGPSNEGVAFAVAGVSAGDNDATNAAKGTAVTVTDTAITAAQHDILITDWSSDLTITNLAAGEVAELSFNRDHDHASDDYGQVVGVLALEIRYVRNVTR